MLFRYPNVIPRKEQFCENLLQARMAFQLTLGALTYALKRPFELTISLRTRSTRRSQQPTRDASVCISFSETHRIGAATSLALVTALTSGQQH
jgi:hypothetical protein